MDAPEEDDRPIEITVADNGPGLPGGILPDYTVRVSSKDAYITPTSGAQGNALKTVVATPFVLSGNRVVNTSSRLAIKNIISALNWTVSDGFQPSPSRCGRRQLQSPGPPGRPSGPTARDLSVVGPRSLQLLEALLNPHAGFILHLGGTVTTFERSDRCGHWRPNEAMSPHWYRTGPFRDLIAAFAAVFRLHNSGRSATI